jgi:hypothetical protein
VVERALERAYWYNAPGVPELQAGQYPGPLRYRSSGRRQTLIGLSVGTHFAASPEGFHSIDPQRALIRSHARDGTLLSTIAIERPAAPVTKVAIERERERARRRFAPIQRSGFPATLQAYGKEQEALLNELPYPDSLPHFADVLIDPLGCLWAIRYHEDETAGPNVAWVIDQREGWLSEVDLPVGFRVFEIGVNYILGVSRDSLEVETITSLFLQR